MLMLDQSLPVRIFNTIKDHWFSEFSNIHKFNLKISNNITVISMYMHGKNKNTINQNFHICQYSNCIVYFFLLTINIDTDLHWPW